MSALVHNPSVLFGLFAAYVLFMCLVDAMEPPTAQDSRKYRFWYRALHNISFNASKAIAAKLPSLSTVEDRPEPPES